MGYVPSVPPESSRQSPKLRSSTNLCWPKTKQSFTLLSHRHPDVPVVLSERSLCDQCNPVSNTSCELPWKQVPGLSVCPVQTPPGGFTENLTSRAAHGDLALASHLAKSFKDRIGGNPQQSPERRIKLENDEDRTRDRQRAKNKDHDYSGARRGE
jgi:hypothetical protein